MYQLNSPLTEMRSCRHLDIFVVYSLHSILLYIIIDGRLQIAVQTWSLSYIADILHSFIRTRLFTFFCYFILLSYWLFWSKCIICGSYCYPVVVSLEGMLWCICMDNTITYWIFNDEEKCTEKWRKCRVDKPCC